jgi:hypothetical protein
MTHMETVSFGDQYLASRSHRATWNGRDVRGSVELVLDRPVDVVIDAKAGSTPLRQGVALRVPKRRARVAESEGERFVLWEDYGQFPTTVTMLAKRPPFTLRVWNCWEGHLGSTDAWVNNAGMLITDQGPSHLELACSAGPGDVDFSDLTVTVRWPEGVAGQVVA